jgi:hypothetical protein
MDWVANARHKIDARYNLIDSNDATAPGVTSASVGVATYAESSEQCGQQLRQHRRHVGG